MIISYFIVWVKTHGAAKQYGVRGFGEDGFTELTPAKKTGLDGIILW